MGLIRPMVGHGAKIVDFFVGVPYLDNLVVGIGGGFWRFWIG